MPELPFAKGHALGNDYFVLDQDDLPWPLSPARIRALCDRNRGIGSDGILLGHLDQGRIELRIYNPDGTEAEKSGNGLRIFAAYLRERGLVGEEWFPVRLATDDVRLRVRGKNADGTLDIAAQMGHATFRGEDVGYRKRGEVLGEELKLRAGGSARIHTVSLGNPHCVVFVDELTREDFLQRAPQLAEHAAFRAGTNVQFARVTGPDTLEAWIFERGAGETLASGSSACAVAAAANRTGRIESREVRVQMPGGEVAIELEESGAVRLRGPAVIVFHGRVREEVVAGLAEA